MRHSPLGWFLRYFHVSFLRLSFAQLQQLSSGIQTYRASLGMEVHSTVTPWMATRQAERNMDEMISELERGGQCRLSIRQVRGRMRRIMLALGSSLTPKLYYARYLQCSRLGDYEGASHNMHAFVLHHLACNMQMASLLLGRMEAHFRHHKDAAIVRNLSITRNNTNRT